MKEVRVSTAVEALLAKDLADLVLAGGPYFAEMAGHGLDRPRVGLALLQHQHRAEVEQAKGAGAQMHLAQEVIGQVGRVEEDVLAGHAEQDVGDHAKKALALPAHHGIAAHS